MAHGGKREGAGRTPTRKEQAPVIIRLMPEYHQRLDEIAKEQKVSRGVLVERMIDDYDNKKGME